MIRSRKLLTAIIVFTIFISCKDENDTIWKKEIYNSEYSIMFPSTYEGGIHQEPSGTTFSKRRNDEKVTISGGFCDELAYPCIASDYIGQSLNNITDSISYTNLRGQLAYLNKRIINDDNQNILGCFYFTNSYGGTFRNSYGLIYLRTCNSSCYRMAGIIEFASSEQQEIEEIIKTIRQK